MGKAFKWFRGLLGLKTTDSHPPKPPTSKKKWTLAKSQKEKDRHKSHHSLLSASDQDKEASKHAIAVAAATAAVAEAAVAAAQAAAVVVQLTSSGRNISTARSGCDSVNARQSGHGNRREEWAAVTIQSHFRAYLAKRALRALKALVKLQALVRGHLVRKQTAYALQRLQALVRAQVRARAGRALNSESPQSSTKSSHFVCPGPATPEKFEIAIQATSAKHDQMIMLKRNGSKSSSSIDHNLEKSQARRMLIHDSRMSGRLSEQGPYPRIHPMDDDKILEVDTGTSKHRPNIFHSSHLSLSSDQICQSFSTSTAPQTIVSPAQSSCEVQSFAEHEDESAYNTPTYYSVSSGRRAFTPTKSDGTRSCLSGFSDHPNYMSYTESSKAKVRRSLSAPKQRPHFERSSSAKRCSVHGSTHVTMKAYHGSGRLDQLGMPVKGEITIGRYISEIGLDYLN